MFHYPPSYTGRVLEKDRCNVKHSMMDLFDYFGTPGKVGKLREGSSYYCMGGGDDATERCGPLFMLDVMISPPVDDDHNA